MNKQQKEKMVKRSLRKILVYNWTCLYEWERKISSNNKCRNCVPMGKAVIRKKLNKIVNLIGDDSVEKECKHFYREFRVESSNGKVDRVWFYCQKCLKIESKSIDSGWKRPIEPPPIKPASTVMVSLNGFL